MLMEARVCPNCGAHNAPQAGTCWRCYASLTAAPVTAVAVQRRPIQLLQISFVKYLAEVPPYQWIALLILLWLLSLIWWLRLPSESVMLFIIRTSLLAIAAVAMDAVLGQGGIDLSIGATAALAGGVALWILPVDVTAAVAAGFVTGVVVGIVNAIINGTGRLPPILTTVITGGLALYLLAPIRAKLPPTWEEPLFAFLCRGTAYGIPLPTMVVALIILLFYWVWLRELSRVSTGERRRGIKYERVWVEPVYILSGILAGIAGVLGAAGSNTTAQPLVPDLTWLLAPLTAALIGGGTLSGDIGGIGSALLGASLVSTMLFLGEELRMPGAGLPLVAILTLLSPWMDAWKRANLNDVRASWQRFLVRIWGEELDRMKMARTLFYMFLGVCAIVFAVYAGISYYAVNRVPPHYAMALKPVGKVEAQFEPNGEWKPVRHRDLLPEGTQVRVDKKSTVLLRFSDGSTVAVRPRSEFTLIAVDDTSQGVAETRFELRSGDIWAWIKRRLERPAKYSIETPAAVLGVRGTQFRATYARGETNVAVVEGTVVVQTPRGEQTVGAGEQAFIERLQRVIRKLRLSEQLVRRYRAIFRSVARVIAAEMRRAWRNNLFERGWLVFCIVLIAFTGFSVYIFHLERLEELKQLRAERSSHALGLVHLYLQQRRFDEARELLQRIVEEDPESEWGQRAQRMLEDWEALKRGESPESFEQPPQEPQG
ncbi:MAG TPA: tetratricopeptide repeat protein [Armatimonadetes bacterium]|nr:tetratricopeptide repeat protein [Armatimonadota bacterium]